MPETIARNRWSTATSIRRPRTRTGTTSTSVAGSVMNLWPAKGRLLSSLNSRPLSLIELLLTEHLGTIHFMGQLSGILQSKTIGNRPKLILSLLIFSFRLHHSDTFCATTIHTVLNATRASSPITARSVTSWLVSIQRYQLLFLLHLDLQSLNESFDLLTNSINVDLKLSNWAKRP